jgi:hypothetical protein
MPGKRKKHVAQIKTKSSVVTISPAECARKDEIDKEARKALHEIGSIATADKGLKMRLHAVKRHLRTIMGDHHHL